MTASVTVKVTPNAAMNQVIGWQDNLLRVRIQGIPEKGRVNEELIAFFAAVLGIAKSQIEIISGHTSRLKRLKITGLTQEEFGAKIAQKKD